ncbi:hypothetical protein M885DRAFT_455702 [Pelagophyceae sp. CCMP2097]|nr:hypothetical protein M885DRAFT_455702 [Pelagophyceae sp. CCMP2097]
MKVSTWAVGINPLGLGLLGAPPIREACGCFRFEALTFRPNLSPAEVLAQGSFGGGYFRDIYSTVNAASYTDAWRELPSEWLVGVDRKTHVSSSKYDSKINAYGKDCGVKASKADAFGLEAWEASGWMHAQDPYGWFQWYCRYFQGRRSDDDARQISRWEKCAGPTGRWRGNLVGKCLRDGRPFDDVSVSPVVRQTLQHWGYQLTSDDFEAAAVRVRARGAAYVPRSELRHVVAPDQVPSRLPEPSELARNASKKPAAAPRAKRRKRAPESQPPAAPEIEA